MAIGIVFFIYIFISFSSYAVEYNLVDEAIEAVEDLGPLPVTQDAQTEADNPVLKKAIEEWVSAGKYTEQGLTIETLSRELGTNRAYLSMYINSAFNCNFREWINTLRIEQACRIIKSVGFVSMADTATRCGFTSASYFTRTFVRVKGMSPLLWKRKQ